MASHLTLLINLSVAPQNKSHTHTPHDTNQTAARETATVRAVRIACQKEGNIFLFRKVQHCSRTCTRGILACQTRVIQENTKLHTAKTEHGKGSRTMLRLKCDLLSLACGSSQLCCGFSIAIFFLQRYRVNSIVGSLLQSFSCSNIESTLLWVLYCNLFPAAE